MRNVFQNITKRPIDDLRFATFHSITHDDAHSSVKTNNLEMKKKKGIFVFFFSLVNEKSNKKIGRETRSLKSGKRRKGKKNNQRGEIKPVDQIEGGPFLQDQRNIQTMEMVQNTNQKPDREKNKRKRPLSQIVRRCGFDQTCGGLRRILPQITWEKIRIFASIHDVCIEYLGRRFDIFQK